MTIRKFSVNRLPVCLALLSVLFLAMPLQANWTAINDLVAEGRYNAAQRQLEQRLTHAKKTKNSVEWTRALIERTKLYFIEQEFEQAAEFLSTQPWPGDAKSQVILALYYADALNAYISNNSWRIHRREQQKNQGKLSVDKMTMAQLVAEADRAYLKAWQGRGHWRNADLKQFPHYFKAGNYPSHVRGTFVDMLTYRWVDLLANARHWTAVQSNARRALNPEQLLNLSGRQMGAFSNAEAHPLLRISALLQTLAQQYRQQNRPEAALEVQRVRITTLYPHFGGSKRWTMLQALRKQAKASQALPWSTMLQWSLAKLEQGSSGADALIRAKAVLDDCVTRHDGSAGNKRCKQLLATIEQPVFDLEVMQSDGLQKRSMLVQHKNVDKLYFRAWWIGLDNMLKLQGQGYDWQNKKLKELLELNNNDAEWIVDLPPTRDYREHDTFVTPPMQQHGVWLIAAADDASFNDSTNVSSAYMNLTGLVANVQAIGDKLNVAVYSGENGQFVPGAQLTLLDDRAQPINKAATDQQGRAQFKLSDGYYDYKVIVRHRDDSVLVEDIYAGRDRSQPDIQQRSLMFTDRSIYRPDQTLQWKVMAYQGNADKGDFRVMPGQKGWVSLVDANGNEIAKQDVQTNGFGSAAGKFTIKTGALLGNWQLRTSWNGSKRIKVEEYKRPTFEVKFNDNKKPLSLNQPATITAKAEFLFGQPVTDASVKWRITRTPDYSYLPYWRRPYGGADAGQVASGTAKPDQKGLINISFTPKPAAQAKSNDEDQALVYRFNVELDVTDSGGETRSAQRSWRIGTSAIKALVKRPAGFFESGQPIELEFQRSDLNDVPRAGLASWTLYRLEQPDQAVLPADVEFSVSKAKLPYATPGDKLRPRWTQAGSAYDVEQVIRQWPDGQAVNRDKVKHDASGKAVVRLKPLAAGLYRLHYKTQDAKGNAFTTQQELMVAAKSIDIASPLTFALKQRSVEVGKQLEMLVGSAFSDTPVRVDIYRGTERLHSNTVHDGVRKLNFPIAKQHRGGLSIRVSAVRDYQYLSLTERVDVPWTDRQLDVSFSTFRDRLKPGQKETWRITVKDPHGRPLSKGMAEIVAGMYDKSLDFFTQHNVFNIDSLYRKRPSAIRGGGDDSLGFQYGNGYSKRPDIAALESLTGSQLVDFRSQLTHTHPAIPNFIDAHTHMHPGGNRKHKHKYSGAKRAPSPKMAPKPAPRPTYQQMAVPMVAAQAVSADAAPLTIDIDNVMAKYAQSTPETTTIRTNFNETAFFYPNLILGDNGSVIFEFEVSESLTEWKVWATALTRDLRGGSAVETTRTSKDLMVRPYLPRFLREGDQAEIAVVINNTSTQNLSGQLAFDIIDPETKKSRAAEFRLNNAKRNFRLNAGASVTLRYPISTPKDPGLIAVRTQATAGRLSDGELRPLAILPSRMHLIESQFAVVNNDTPATLSLPNLAQNNDPTRQHEKLVVNVEGQLFQSALKALPYLVEYPYECTEQTLNRFLSTSIVKSVYDRHSAIAGMAKQLAARSSRLEQWEKPDANRSLLLEETPWLRQAQGGQQATEKLFNILNDQVANQQRADALGKLLQAQNDDGGFPWWAGGPSSPTMTLYQLEGFARALEFKQDAPKEAVQKAWQYLHTEYKDKLLQVGTLREITMITYLLTAYPDKSWLGTAFSAQAQARMLSFAFQNRGKLSRQLKLYLALALHRSNRKAEAQRVLATIMDGAVTDKRLGTYWKPDRRSWLWYYDNTVSHALTLRVLTEMAPNDPRIDGLVQWLLLDKKMNHWKSTRATAESIYALVHYLKNQQQVFRLETATIQAGPQLRKQLVFKPDLYNAEQQVVIPGEDITPAMQNIIVSKQGGNKLPMFASATWHYSTDRIPTQAQGDLLQVNRRFYKRFNQNGKWILQPLQAGTMLKVGDQVEVQLTIRAQHTADYVHLRSPRGAGFEPMEQLSGYQWQGGVGYYAEIRDSGANYFFDRLPKGERKLRYRLRATTAGQFRVAPATLQSIYAPEFTAYSRGMRVGVVQ